MRRALGLLRRQHPNITPIFVSTQRLEEWRELSGAKPDASHVIPNGIDPAALLKLSPRARSSSHASGLLSAEIVMLAAGPNHKAKDLEMGIDAAAAVRATGRTVQLLITGPPGPHNPRSLDYVADLKRHTERLGLQESVRFLFEESTGPPATTQSMRPPSRPLYAERCRDPPQCQRRLRPALAEAAIFRVPVVCTDLPAFREVATDGRPSCRHPPALRRLRPPC